MPPRKPHSGICTRPGSAPTEIAKSLGELVEAAVPPESRDQLEIESFG